MEKIRNYISIIYIITFIIYSSCVVELAIVNCIKIKPISKRSFFYTKNGISTFILLTLDVREMR